MPGPAASGPGRGCCSYWTMTVPVIDGWMPLPMTPERHRGPLARGSDVGEGPSVSFSSCIVSAPDNCTRAVRTVSVAAEGQQSDRAGERPDAAHGAGWCAGARTGRATGRPADPQKRSLLGCVSYGLCKACGLPAAPGGPVRPARSCGEGRGAGPAVRPDGCRPHSGHAVRSAGGTIRGRPGPARGRPAAPEARRPRGGRLRRQLPRGRRRRRGKVRTRTCPRPVQRSGAR